MNTNNSQIGNSPLENLFQNNNNQSDIDQLLSDVIVVNSQPLIQFNTTNNMIPSQIPLIPNAAPEHNNLSRRQEGRQRRRRRQRERRREAQRQRQQEEQPLQQQRRQHHGHQRSRQRRQERYERWQERLQQCEMETGDRWRQRFNDSPMPLDSFDEWMDEIGLDQLLAEYDLEKINSKERWEQEQLNELEGFVVLEQLALVHDEIEQMHQIDTVQKIKEEQEESYHKEQIQLEQWEKEQSTQLQGSQVLQYISMLEDDIE